MKLVLPWMRQLGLSANEVGLRARRVSIVSNVVTGLVSKSKWLFRPSKTRVYFGNQQMVPYYFFSKLQNHFFLPLSTFKTVCFHMFSG